MRLWHQDLIRLLPDKQLCGQHRECCALRGLGWGRKHSTVNYVFKYPYGYLVLYHLLVMSEMFRRGMNPDRIWGEARYRGKRLGYAYKSDSEVFKDLDITRWGHLYPEHDAAYLQECLDNLKAKGIIIKLQ